MAIKTFKEFLENKNDPVLNLVADKLTTMVQQSGVKTNKNRQDWEYFVQNTALPWGKVNSQSPEDQASYIAKHIFDRMFSDQMSPQPSPEQDAKMRQQKIQKMVSQALPQIPHENLTAVYGGIANILAKYMR